MEYNEQKAQEIIAAYNLDAKTSRVWKSRGSIPKKYFDNSTPDIVSDKKLNRAKTERILKIVEADFLNKSLICRLADLSDNRYNYVKKNKLFTDAELLRITKELKQIKAEISNCFQGFSPRKLKNLLCSNVLKYNKISVANKYRIEGVRNKSHDVDFDLYCSVRDDYFRAAVQINL